MELWPAASLREFMVFDREFDLGRAQGKTGVKERRSFLAVMLKEAFPKGSHHVDS